MDLQTLSTVSESLPSRFDFYGCGEVSRLENASAASSLSSLISGKSAFSYRLLGEQPALLIVLFESHLDSSMYSELGNILASKLCQSLSEQGEGDLMITPPQPLGPENLARLSRMNFPFIHNSYKHEDRSGSVLVETLILPLFTSGADGAEGHIGHA